MKTWFLKPLLFQIFLVPHYTAVPSHIVALKGALTPGEEVVGSEAARSAVVGAAVDGVVDVALSMVALSSGQSSAVSAQVQSSAVSPTGQSPAVSAQVCSGHPLREGNERTSGT